MLRAARFTLVELMIVVAIIMVLAAIAIPQLSAMQLRSKRSELAVNIDGISTAQVGYEAANNAYVDSYNGITNFTPDDAPKKTARPWPAGTLYDVLGWSPDGAVRGCYSTCTYAQGCGLCLPSGSLKCTMVSTTTAFCAGGITDVDGNGTPACAYMTSDNGFVQYTANDVY